MMRLCKVFILAFAILSSSPGLSAQGVVTLDSCRAMALTNNKQLRIRGEAIRQREYQRKEAFAAYLPAIDFTGGYLYNQKNLNLLTPGDYLSNIDPSVLAQLAQKFPQIGEALKDPEMAGLAQKGLGAVNEAIDGANGLLKKATSFDIHNVFFGAITLTQPVYMGGKIVAMNRLTHYAEEAARALHNSEAENVIYAVDAAYWQVVSLKAKQRLAVSYVALLDTLRQNVNAMVQQGVATPSDLLTVEVKLNQANVDLTKVDNGLVLSRMALAQVCGLPVDTQFTLADEDRDFVDCTAPVATSYDIADVYARRQDLRALEMGIGALRQKERVALSDMLPKIALVGSYTFSNPNTFNGFEKRFGGAFSVGAMVSIPLWHWGGNYNKYRAAQAETRMAEMQLDDAKDLINLQVSQSAFKAQEAVKTYHTTLANLDKANENLRQANLGFREGVMTTDNVMEAQTAWLKANSEKIDALIDVHLCDVYLSKVLGTLPYPTDY